MIARHVCHVTPRYFACSLSCNKIARQVAWCNSTFVHGGDNLCLIKFVYVWQLANMWYNFTNIISYTILFADFLAIVHYIGRSLGLDCDCDDYVKCEVIALGAGIVGLSCAFMCFNYHNCINTQHLHLFRNLPILALSSLFSRCPDCPLIVRIVLSLFALSSRSPHCPLCFHFSLVVLTVPSLFSLSPRCPHCPLVVLTVLSLFSLSSRPHYHLVLLTFLSLSSLSSRCPHCPLVVLTVLSLFSLYCRCSHCPLALLTVL